MEKNDDDDAGSDDNRDDDEHKGTHTLQKLQGGTATGRNMRYFVLSSPLGTACGSVTTTNYGGASSFS